MATDKGSPGPFLDVDSGPAGPGGPRGPGDPRRRKIVLSPETLALFNESGLDEFFYIFWSRDADVLRRSSNAPASLTFPDRSADSLVHKRIRGGLREAYQFTEMGECALVGRTMAAEWQALRQFAWRLWAAGAAVLALGLGGGWWLVSRAIRPVELISAAASRISGGNLSERIPLKDTNSELGRLTAVLNSTFARLEAAFAQQKQFTADASHELRTPIAVLLSEAQTTLARERSAAEYRETVEACAETAQQMRRLTESLLELARFDAGEESIPRNPVDLAQTARECVEAIRPLASGRGIRFHCELGPVTALGDAGHLGQVITNLLSNAIYYNKPDGEIRLRTLKENGQAFLSVSDNGIGVAGEDLPHIFERFYRADKSRSRSNGRSGLGLAICKTIVEAHGGTIEATSNRGVGSTFLVKLPAR